jgi:hypothetical protein
LAAEPGSGKSPDNPNGTGMRHVRALSRLLERLAQGTTEWVGSSWAFVVAALLTATWLVTGSLFHYSDTW